MAPKTHFTVLISNGVFDVIQASNQKSALKLLDDLCIPYDVVDGMDPEQREKRNSFFAISGIRGNYPQIFSSAEAEAGEEDEHDYLGGSDWLQSSSVEELRGLVGLTDGDEMESKSVGGVAVQGGDPDGGENKSALDEEYEHLHPHAYHLQLPSHHKTDGGIPYATIDAERKSRAIIKLVNCLALKEEFFVDYNGEGTATEGKEGDVDEEIDSQVEDDEDDEDSPSSLHQLSNQCHRLLNQLTKLGELKHRGSITQTERCEMILKVLELLCATVEIVDGDDVKEGVSSMVIDGTDTPKSKGKPRVNIHHDSVGYILHGETGRPKGEQHLSAKEKDEQLSHPFALPAPARLSLLSVASLLLQNKKDWLRGVSNSAIDTGSNLQQRLIISHHALLRMLLITAPYLDEHKLDTPPKEANNMRSSVLKKSVNVIRSCRRFFDQGGDTVTDATAKELWSTLRNDLQYHTHSNSCFRALVLMYLFHPTKCSSEYYTEVLPVWMECWRNIDRCPEWDYLWMVLFSRARKMISPENEIWTTLRKHMLSSCKYWLQIPVGGVSADKSFPHAQSPAKRSFPARLKNFLGYGGRYEEGMDFVGRLTKLLMFCTCAGSVSNSSDAISDGTSDLLRFLSFITPYYNPSNTGGWTFPLGAFLHYLSYEVCARVGIMAGWKALKRDHPNVAEKLLKEEPYLEKVNLKATEIVALLDGMLPLCQQSLYSKNPTVSHAGETALLYLAEIDPSRVTPPLIDFSLRALDISSVNLSHQAPAALQLLSRLTQPALRAQSDIVLARLPDMLRLTLAGIDGNDQDKSLRTLIFYRNLVMWLPVGGSITLPNLENKALSSTLDGDGKDGTMQVGKQLMETRYSFVELEEYKSAIDKLPQSSLLASREQPQGMAMDEDDTVLMQEAMSAMSDWSLMFLDRIYELLRAAGEQEKLGKGHGGTGMRHTSVDVAMAKNFSRIMKETLVYFFSAMDGQTYKAALRSVVRFFEEETLPFAVKDASLLCQAVCSTRFAPEGSEDGRIDICPGLDALVPVLTEDLEHASAKSSIYRLRCLAGAVRYAGSTVLKHRDAITSAIAFALSKPDDRVLFKTGCKLLRHALSSQCEEYPIAQCFHPMRLGVGGAANGPAKSADSPSTAVNSPTTSVTPTSRFTVLISNGVFDVIQASNQKSALQLLHDMSIPYDVVDGMDPEQREKRNTFFKISGIRGNYPQVFSSAVGGDTYSYLGGADWLHSSSVEELWALVGQSNEEEMTAESVDDVAMHSESAPTLTPVLGSSALLRGDRIWWHVPSGEQLDFTVNLLSQFALSRWNELGAQSDGKTPTPAGSVNLQQWRQALRVVRYSLRGCSGILLDQDPATILSQEGDGFCPKEIATAKLIATSTDETMKVLQGLRRRLCFNLMDMMCLIAKDTADCESVSNGGENSSSGPHGKTNEMGSISSDTKILSEVIQLAELILARRGAQIQAGSGKTIYRGQKEILMDFALASETDFLSSVLSRCNDEVHTGINHSLYKDGEDSGKTISRALLVNRIHIANQELTSNASSAIPRRLRKLRGIGPGIDAPESLFTLDITLQKLQEHLGDVNGQSYDSKETSLEAYEALVDGLCALSCHPNINVRGSALSIVDFALTRFGWVVKQKGRPSRLLAAICLNDEGQRGVHGIPSCAQLVNQVNSQGKRSRFAEVVKGVAKIVALPKVMKHFLYGADNRFELIKTLCGTQKLLQLLPPEEVAKVVHYMNSIFLAYRSRLCSLPRSTEKEQLTHEACLAFLLGILQDGNAAIAASADKTAEEEGEEEAGAMHWRDRLVAAWFVLKLIDDRDLIVGSPKLLSQVWSTCFKLIEEEAGQPLQRVSLGLLGRLVSLALVDMSQTSGAPDDSRRPDISALCSMFSNEKFCLSFGNALVFDHREDTSVGGGHSAQWSSGITEIIRDATTHNLARRTLFPFNRISQKSHTFKLTHSQLIETILLAIGHDNAKVTSDFLIEQAKQLVASPPSEDQRNQQVTSAEIFGGVCRALIQYSNSDDERDEIWESVLLPFLDEAIVKMPTNILAAFYDACRYGIHHFPPSYFFPLLKWSVAKVQSSLWQHEVNGEAEESNGGAASAMADRFALQGKWLLFIQAVIIELDNEDDVGAVCKPPFYSDLLNLKKEPTDSDAVTPTELELGKSWKYVNDRLTPCLLNAIGHPYDKCRDHIASCLFRMCYCHRKFINAFKALGNEKDSQSSDDPGIEIMKQLSSVRDSGNYLFKEKNNALGTARKFVACCVHWGDAKHEYPDFIIPLLPQTFESLQTTEDEVSPEDRGVEADLVKGYRYALADISSSCVAAYGVSHDMTRVLDILKDMSTQPNWQIRQASAHFLRNFQGANKFLFTAEQNDTCLTIAISLLADERREVSSAATSTLTGILAMLPQATVEELVSKYIKIASKSIKKKKRKNTPSPAEMSVDEAEAKIAKEKERASRQQKSVFVLCAVVMGRPYDTPPYIPEALAALSKHSFEQRAALSVREVVKMVCSEFKRTHTDNWEAHRKQFTQVQLEALDDVVSTPHYYA